MKINNKYLIIFIIVFLLSVGLIWQYKVSKSLMKSYKPIRVEMLLEPMSATATGIAKNSKYIYIGSSNQKVNIEKITEEGGQVKMVLIDTGIIYDDSAFFASQRLVFNTKVKVHALFDDVGTVVNIEYIK